MKKVSYLIAALLASSSIAYAGEDPLVQAVEAGEKILKKLPHPPLPSELPLPPQPPMPGVVPVPVPQQTAALKGQPRREDYAEEGERHRHHDRGHHYGERKHHHHEDD